MSVSSLSNRAMNEITIFITDWQYRQDTRNLHIFGRNESNCPIIIQVNDIIWRIYYQTEYQHVNELQDMLTVATQYPCYFSEDWKYEANGGYMKEKIKFKVVHYTNFTDFVEGRNLLFSARRGLVTRIAYEYSDFGKSKVSIVNQEICLVSLLNITLGWNIFQNTGNATVLHQRFETPSVLYYKIPFKFAGTVEKTMEQTERGFNLRVAVIHQRGNSFAVGILNAGSQVNQLTLFTTQDTNNGNMIRNDHVGQIEVKRVSDTFLLSAVVDFVAQHSIHFVCAFDFPSLVTKLNERQFYTLFSVFNEQCVEVNIKLFKTDAGRGRGFGIIPLSLENYDDISFPESMECLNSSDHQIAVAVVDDILSQLESTQFIETHFDVCLHAGVVFRSHSVGPCQMLHSQLSRLGKRRDFVFQTKSDGQKDTESEIRGGFVLEPIAGLCFNGKCAVWDFKSFYPSIVSTYNIDACTRIEDINSVALNCIRTGPFLFVCREHSLGLLPQIMQTLLHLKSKVSNTVNSNSRYKINALKSCMNSIIGALRHYNSSIFAAVTMTGRHILDRIISVTRNHPQVDKILWGDTDSLCVSYKCLSNVADIHNFYQTQIKEFLQSQIVSPNSNVVSIVNFMQFELEGIVDAMITSSKKKCYAMVITNQITGQNKLKMVGLTKSNQPPVVNHMTESFCKIILQNGILTRQSDLDISMRILTPSIIDPSELYTVFNENERVWVHDVVLSCSRKNDYLLVTAVKDNKQQAEWLFKDGISPDRDNKKWLKSKLYEFCVYVNEIFHHAGSGFPSVSWFCKKDGSDYNATVSQAIYGKKGAPFIHSRLARGRERRRVPVHVAEFSSFYPAEFDIQQSLHYGLLSGGIFQLTLDALYSDDSAHQRKELLDQWDSTFNDACQKANANEVLSKEEIQDRIDFLVDELTCQKPQCSRCYIHKIHGSGPKALNREKKIRSRANVLLSHTTSLGFKNLYCLECTNFKCTESLKFVKRCNSLVRLKGKLHRLQCCELEYNRRSALFNKKN